MKVKTTKKKIMENYDKIICVGYCDLQYLLRCKEASYYTDGVYGWNADIYICGDVAIVTGYRPFGNIEANYAICKKYEDKAEMIVKSRDYRVIDSQLNLLIFNFIEEVTK